MRCNHCGNPIRDITNPKLFCCIGCEIAYKLIDKLNLQAYYEYCRNIYYSKPLTVYDIQNNLSYDDHIITPSSSHYKINMIVEGIHCGSCVWLIESTLKAQPDVINARLNLSTKRLSLEWSDDKNLIHTLVKLVFQLGYKLIPFTPDASELEAKHNEKELLRAISVSGLVSMAMMMMIYGIWAGNLDNSMSYYMRVILHWIATLIAVPAIFYSGMPFFRSAFQAIKARHSNMDIPISIAIITSSLISIQETIRGSDYTYYDAAISLIFFLLIGRYLDMKARNKAREHAQNLVLSQATSLTIINENGEFILTPITKAKVGDMVFVAAGEKIPVDGIITEGSSELDISLISGETLPVAVHAGGEVIAGTVNILSPIKIKIIRLGENTTLAEIIRMMEDAEQGRAKYVSLADRLSALYTPVVLIISLATFIGWQLYGESLANSLLYAVAVLIITCPCALGLAIPIVQIVATSRLIAQGIIVKSKNALEKLAKINTVVFDKTGTLTLGKPVLTNATAISSDKLIIIESLAQYSKHPLCKALHNKNSGNVVLDKVEEIKGCGVRGYFKNIPVMLGSRLWCGANATDLKDDKLEMWFKYGEQEFIRLEFEDQIKSDTTLTIKELKRYGFNIEIISGDRLPAVQKIASLLEVEAFKASYTPTDKFQHLLGLTADNKFTLMVGDGLNDSAALKAAFVSMSPSDALAITQTASDIVFQGDKLLPVLEAYKVARFSDALVKQNLAFSLIYNLVTVPIAVCGLASPIFAAIVMSSSSIIVILNSLRLNFKK